ncbi:MAG: metalloregulator ArsR/SmtB family transcription factor [Candidatus Fermentibacteraceae bacterium]
MNPSTRNSCCDGLSELLSPGLFKALSDPNRLAILIHLAMCGSPQSVTDVTPCCPVDFSVVSRHLQVLREAGAAASVKKGRTVLYTLRTGVLVTMLRRIADALEACCPGGECLLEGGNE